MLLLLLLHYITCDMVKFAYLDLETYLLVGCLL